MLYRNPLKKIMFCIFLFSIQYVRQPLMKCWWRLPKLIRRSELMSVAIAWTVQANRWHGPCNIQSRKHIWPNWWRAFVCNFILTTIGNSNNDFICCGLQVKKWTIMWRPNTRNLRNWQSLKWWRKAVAWILRWVPSNSSKMVTSTKAWNIS